MGIPGSLSLMKGPYSVSIPSLASRMFLVHTFPCTKSLSSYSKRGKTSECGELVMCSDIPIAQEITVKHSKNTAWKKLSERKERNIPFTFKHLYL